MEDLVVEAQNIFPNWPVERKRSRSTLLFINHSKFREKIKTGRERKQSQKQTLQIFLSPQKVLDKNHFIHTTLQTTIDLHNIDSAKCKKKIQTNKN